MVGWLIAFIASIWVLIAVIIGVRAALDFSTIRAVITALIGWLIFLILMILPVLLGLPGLSLPL